MGLSVVSEISGSDQYLGGLQAFIRSIHPALLAKSVWGYETLAECFGIDESSGLYRRAHFAIEDHKRVAQAASRLRSTQGRERDTLCGVLFDFSDIGDPHRTELMAYFAWSLQRPENRHYTWFIRARPLIMFCRETASHLKERLIDYGHPIERGNGAEGSSPLRLEFTMWRIKRGYSNNKSKQTWRSSDENGTSVLREKEYEDSATTIANQIIFALIILREKAKPLIRRDLILFEDIYEEHQFDARRRPPYIHFYKFKLPWLREFARRFLLNKIEYKELSPTTLAGYLPRLKEVEDCILSTRNNCTPKCINQKFVDDEFIAWGRARKLIGQNWYSDVLNMIKWASSYMPELEWSSIIIEKRNVRRIHSYYPRSHSYESKLAEKLVPEEVVEQLFPMQMNYQLH